MGTARMSITYLDYIFTFLAQKNRAKKGAHSWHSSGKKVWKWWPKNCSAQKSVILEKLSIRCWF